MRTRLVLSLTLFSAVFVGFLDASQPIHLQIEPVAAPQAMPFSLHDVRLLDGPFKQGQQVAAQYLLDLEADRLLANFRKEAGLSPKAEHYGGWESRGVSGHCGGHYLSGCSLAFAATGDPRFLERVNYFVRELAECQKANGDGYVSAIPEGRRAYEQVAEGNIRSAGFDLNGVWVPNYTMHKVFAGLRDAYRLAGNRQALEVEKQLADWFEKTHATLSEGQMQQIMVAEHGGLNETFADLYGDTGDRRYLALSRRFHHKDILDPLAHGIDILPGKHANTQIPKIIGVATRYELAGDNQDRAIADFFWDRVVNHHSYVTGGHCDHEHFGPPDQLNDRLSTMTTETCNVYNMLALTTHVFGWNPSVLVADFYERALLNHMRASQHPDGRVIYNLSLQPGHHKEYQSQFDGFTCCVGTGMENHVRYGEGIYYHDDQRLWVNLFIASELNWQDLGIKLRQETEWPEGDQSQLTISAKSPQRFELLLRRPNWAGDDFAVSVNGAKVGSDGDASGYVVIDRTWKGGDTVTVHFPMELHTESMPDNANRIAILHGPTLLAADLGPINDPESSKPMYVPALVTDGKAVAEWVKPTAAEKSEFRTAGVGRPRDVNLVPFHTLHDRRYTVYLDIFGEAQWAEKEQELRAEQARIQALSARTLDELRIGEMQPERDHQLVSENSRVGEHAGRKWRDARDGGWFEFEMQADGEVANELHCTYWGSDSGNRHFEILIDGEKVADQSLDQDAPNKFFDVTYPVPRSLTAGKSTVVVTFQAHPTAMAGGLFGCRMLRAEQ
ncbi:glycoside hydrolase family 127 protein [Novipirellula artificiosorum]|uniref:Non-reducing end beta-L-arabinofuranosidase n=1 Tax=Novipirellula artificiosorum TaxID=2528016 RepID=A0A5C6D6Y3_9BACT|nr:glycoside hydrolase family 127 protein [Novipirellula artificiosorum]TWU31584.1 Non-reducing end beta-L-arabinofuranosidase [Novipirellula artificiosorum]